MLWFVILLFLKISVAIAIIVLFIRRMVLNLLWKYFRTFFRILLYYMICWLFWILRTFSLLLFNEIYLCFPIIVCFMSRAYAYRLYAKIFAFWSIWYSQCRYRHFLWIKFFSHRRICMIYIYLLWMCNILLKIIFFMLYCNFFGNLHIYWTKRLFLIIICYVLLINYRVIIIIGIITIVFICCDYSYA